MSGSSNDNAEDRATLRRVGIRAVVIETVVDVILIVVLAFAITRLPSPSGRIIAAACIGLALVIWAFGRWRRFRRLPREESAHPT